ncbi:MAG: hypothetical protein JWL77_6720 [Chthonomonadaceae bacterium]|nr:hypothetical protein [Chthonomonadaceae bacterium]
MSVDIGLIRKRRIGTRQVYVQGRFAAEKGRVAGKFSTLVENAQHDEQTASVREELFLNYGPEFHCICIPFVSGCFRKASFVLMWIV